MTALGGGFLFLFVLVALTSIFLIRNSYHALEEREMHSNWTRAQGALVEGSRSLFKRAYDWAKWDDMRDFVATGQASFIHSNLMPSTIVGMELTGVVVCRKDLSVVHSTILESKGEAPILLDSILRTELVQSRTEGWGLAEFGGRLAWVAVRSIQDSEEKMPTNGFVVFVKSVDSRSLAEVSASLGLNVTLAQKLAWKGRDHEHTGEGMVTVRGPLLGRDGKELATLEVTEGQELLALSDRSLYWIMGVILGVGCVSALGGYLVIRRFVTGRLVQLHREIGEVDPLTGAGEVSVTGFDEIAGVARSINTLVTQIGHYRTESMLLQASMAKANSQLEEQVRSRTYQLERLNSTLQNALDGIVCLNLDGVIQRANIVCKSIFDRSILAGLSLRDLLEPESQGVYDAAMSRLAVEPRVEADLSLLPRPRGASHVQAVFLRDPSAMDGQEAIHAFVKDVSEHRRLAEELAFQAYHDSLTGLPNRQYLQKAMKEAAVNTEGSSGVLFIDLDDFKLVNDSLGHEVGDQVLISVAETLSSCIRPRDLLARLGGDEFIILLKGLSGPSEAEQVANRVVRSLKKSLKVGDRELTVTASVGIAVCRNDELNLPELMQAADTAMYRSKDDGKAKYTVFSPSMSQEVQERQELIQAMRTALEDGSFHLNYQPIVRFDTLEPIAAEALIRWNHPLLGPISPVKFIPLAEETGLIMPLGEWVLREACRTAKALQDLGLPTGITANVSPRQVAQGEFDVLVAQQLSELQLEPWRLTLEITESLAMENPEVTALSLAKLRELGVKLAIDDFGTGYSSLSQLQKLQVDKVKMDRSFVQNLSSSSERVTVVGAIISICRALELEVIAEGVETEDEADVLRVIGCDCAQGYLYSRPLSQAAFMEYLKSLVLSRAA
jgi:diguanylate cyclase (GGDEF)-like protein/PAS domain S-box-containing protein